MQSCGYIDKYPISPLAVRKLELRARFGSDFSEGLDGVLCGYSCIDGGRVDWVECAEHAATLRWVAFANYETDDGRGSAFCGRSGD